MWEAINSIMRMQRKAPPIERVSRDVPIPLAFSQYKFYFPSHNIFSAHRLTGLINHQALVWSLNEVVRRHEALRTTFSIRDDELIQMVEPELHVEAPIVDLTSLSPTQANHELKRIANFEAVSPFNLTRGPLLRATLVQLADQESVLLLTVHHIVADGYSKAILFREISAYYHAYVESRSVVLQELVVQFPDFAAWQRGWFRDEVLDDQLSYWRRHLGDTPVISGFPIEESGYAAPSPKSCQGFILSPSLTTRVKELSRKRRNTLFVTLLSALSVLIYTQSEQTNILIGTHAANRNRREIRPLIGSFAHLMGMRVDISGNPTFLEVMHRANDVVLGAFGHQDIPFEIIADELQGRGEIPFGFNIRTVFALRNYPYKPLSLSRLTLTPLPKLWIPPSNYPSSAELADSRNDGFSPDLWTGSLQVDEGESLSHISRSSSDTAALPPLKIFQERIDMILYMVDAEEGLEGGVQYDVKMFQHAMIRGIIEGFITLLENIVIDPNQRLSALRSGLPS